MRRRSKRAPNLSESTGKIGQELPSNQPAPLVPFYPDEVAAPPPQQARSLSPRQGNVLEPSGRSPESRPAQPERPARPERFAHPQASPAWSETPGSGRLELETQPETPSVPPPEAQPAA